MSKNDMMHVICSICYAPTAVNRIFVAQLILLVVTFNMLPLAFILLIIMLLLLFAAEIPSAPLFPYRSFSVSPKSERCSVWMSETGGVVICLASTLMVLDHFCGKFPTPTR